MRIFSENYLPTGLILASLVVSGVWSDPLFANKRPELTFFEKGEELCSKGKYTEAINAYNSALKFNTTDGRIIVEKKIDKIIEQVGRFGAEKIKDETKYADYFPNKRKKECQFEWDEKIRLEQQSPELELVWWALEEPINNSALDGGEDAKFRVEIKNIGVGDALDVDLKVKNGNKKILVKPVDAISAIRPNDSQIVFIDVSVGLDVEKKDNTFEFVAIERSGLKSKPVRINLESLPHQSPVVKLGAIKHLEHRQADKLRPNETVVVNATVLNEGRGVADKILLEIELGEGLYSVTGSKTLFEWNKIYPSENWSAAFKFKTKTDEYFKEGDSVYFIARLRDKNKNVISQTKYQYRIAIDKGRIIHISPNERRDTGFGIPEAPNVNPPLTNMKNLNAVAVVIGNRYYQHAPNVDFAENDAYAIKQYLVKSFGYAEQNIIYIKDATTAAFVETFGSETNYKGRLFSKVNLSGSSDVFIYYSGHGAPDLNPGNRKPYLVPTDAAPDYLALSGYTLDTLYKNLAKLNVNSITIVLDACFSGDSDGGALIPNASPVAVKVEMAKSNLKNAAIFTSSSPGEISSWHRDERHGLFTYFFLKGLNGDADIDGDKSILTSEMQKYLGKHVPYHALQISNRRQTPTLQQTSDLTLVNYGTSKLAVR